MPNLSIVPRSAGISLFGTNLASWPLIQLAVSPQTAMPPRSAPAAQAASAIRPTTADASMTASSPASVSHFPRMPSNPSRRLKFACWKQTVSATPARQAPGTGNNSARCRAETRRPASCHSHPPRVRAGTAPKPSFRRPLFPATHRASHVPVAVPCRKARSFSIGCTFMQPGVLHAGGPNSSTSYRCRQLRKLMQPRRLHAPASASYLPECHAEAQLWVPLSSPHLTC